MAAQVAEQDDAKLLSLVRLILEEVKSPDSLFVRGAFLAVDEIERRLAALRGRVRNAYPSHLQAALDRERKGGT